MTQERRIWTSDDGGHSTERIAVTPGRPIELEVQNSSGTIQIRPGDEPDVLLDCSGDGMGHDEAGVDIKVHDNQIRIKTLQGNRGGFDLGRTISRFIGGDVEIDMMIQLPRALLAQQPARLKLRSASGEISVLEIPGDIDVSTASGDVHLVDTRGDLTLHSASGDLTIDRPHGRLTTRSASGDIHVEGGSLARLVVNTASGDVSINAAMTGIEPARVEAVSGDVQLTIAAAGATVSYTTVSGDYHVEEPFRQAGRGRWQLGAGSGGPEISVKTVSGDLRVRGEVLSPSSPDDLTVPIRTEPIPPTPPTPPTAPTSPTPPTPPTPPPPPTEFAEAELAAAIAETDVASPPIPEEAAPSANGSDEPNRLSVLQALERGEIDIDEAMSRLDAMDHGPEQ